MKEINLLETFDAREWAKEFMRLFGDRRNEIDEGLMIGWFANAIMTGYDFQGRKLQPKVDKLKQLILLTDPSVSNEEMNSLSAKQWNEYIKEFPDEAD